jgi:hypothetical protein
MKYITAIVNFIATLTILGIIDGVSTNEVEIKFKIIVAICITSIGVINYIDGRTNK